MTRVLRFLCAAALVCGLAGVAKADDFQMQVVDPTFTPTAITSDSFNITLGTCQPNQLPTSLVGTYIGCFTGINLTGAPITSLQVLIPIFSYQGSLQTAGCAPAAGQIFHTVTCGTTANGLDFYVDFSNGSIAAAANGGDCDYDGDAKGLNQDDYACDTSSIFTIAEAGVPAGPNGEFPKNFSVEANVTPEPNSILLLSTGVLSIGLFGAFRRRQSLMARIPSTRGGLN
jgi:hypothetical protein